MSGMDGITCSYLDARNRARALSLVEFMIRRGVREIEVRSAAPMPGRPRTHWYTHDADTGEGYGHRLPPKAGPEIVRRANRMAALARRLPPSRQIAEPAR